jgi:hypothetical protein
LEAIKTILKKQITFPVDNNARFAKINVFIKVLLLFLEAIITTIINQMTFPALKRKPNQSCVFGNNARFTKVNVFTKGYIYSFWKELKPFSLINRHFQL